MASYEQSNALDFDRGTQASRLADALFATDKLICRCIINLHRADKRFVVDYELLHVVVVQKFSDSKIMKKYAKSRNVTQIIFFATGTNASIAITHSAILRFLQGRHVASIILKFGKAEEVPMTCQTSR